MFIAAAKIVLDFWGNEELRDKKKLIEALSQQLREEYSLTLNEVEALDDLEKCVLGLCFCSSEREKARVKMESILKFIDQKSAARVVSEDSDIIQFS